MRHIKKDITPVEEARLALVAALSSLGDRKHSGLLADPEHALGDIAFLLSCIYNTLDDLTLSIYQVSRLHGALKAANAALGIAAIEARLLADGVRIEGER